MSRQNGGRDSRVYREPQPDYSQMDHADTFEYEERRALGVDKPRDPRMKDPKYQPFEGNPNSRTARTPIANRPKEKTFQLDFYSEQDKRNYAGQFTVSKPKLKDQSRIAAAKAAFLGNRYYDARNPGCGVPLYQDVVAEAMAFLDCMLTEWPNWWEGAGEVEDAAVIMAVFEEAIEIDPFRAQFLSNKENPRGKAGTSSNDEFDAAEQSRNDAADLVDSTL